MPLTTPEPCRRTSGNRSGFTLHQVLLTAVAVGCLATAGYWYTKHRAMADAAARNLRAIYMALEWYELDQGRLPDLAFFPNDPLHDNDSLLVKLGKYGVTEEMTVPPDVPEALRDLSLCYVWNVDLNGRKLHEPGPPKWMLVNIQALSDDLPPPHLWRYHILYSDGQVERSRVPPPGLRIL
jgi:hypothetical protein